MNESMTTHDRDLWRHPVEQQSVVGRDARSTSISRYCLPSPAGDRDDLRPEQK